MKILIVDDEIEDLKKMESLLLNEKYDVITVNDGASAYDLISASKFDLIILDIKMPTLTGYDLLRLMRQRLNHKVPIVFVSVVPKKAVEMEDVEGFVQKPYSDKVFIQEIKRVLKKK